MLPLSSNKIYSMPIKKILSNNKHALESNEKYTAQFAFTNF